MMRPSSGLALGVWELRPSSMPAVSVHHAEESSSEAPAAAAPSAAEEDLPRSPTTSSELPSGTLIDRRYRISREIARGGMCVVYCATQVFTGRTVALKVLRQELAEDPRARVRLLREARMLELSRSSHAVDLLDAGLQDGGAPFLVMEMVEGRTLEGLLSARWTLGIAEVIRIGIQVCRALSSAHDRCVVHRDVKPGNIILVRNSRRELEVKLIDFGIAMIMMPTIQPSGPPALASKVTSAGEFFGTPEYIAPEIVQAPEVLDRRSDIYSLGVTLYECLAGTVPYTGSFGDVFLKVHLAGVAPDVRECRRDVPEALAGIIVKAMAPKPEDRYEHPREMEEALAGALQSSGDDVLLGGRPRAVPPPLPAGHQRRRFPRVPYVTPVSILTAEGIQYFGRSEDISEGGMLVLISESCEDQVEVEVRFMSPQSGSIVQAQAVTRWAKGSRGKQALGLEFCSLSEPIRREIAQYVGAASLLD